MTLQKRYPTYDADPKTSIINMGESLLNVSRNLSKKISNYFLMVKIAKLLLYNLIQNNHDII
jgi:hypothetical protein